MDNELRALLQNYLDGGVGLDDVRSWVALNIFEAPADTENDVDRLAIELSHLDDGSADQEYFRKQIEGMLVIVVAVEINEWIDVARYIPLVPLGSRFETASTSGPATPTIVPVQEWQPA